MIRLFAHQEQILSKLKTGSILWGGVGSGKSIAALAYYYRNECGGSDKTAMQNPKKIYIITTAMKRDSLEWEGDAAYFGLSTQGEDALLYVDSWNKISKYVDVKNAFFIFDEQRVVGSGAWVKAFIKIAKNNSWILLSATPGDTWLDYIPVFVANGFYKNRTAFLREHVVYNTFTKYPKVDHYVETGRLIKLRKEVLVEMPHTKPTIAHHEDVVLPYMKENFDLVKEKRWNPYKNSPIKDIGDLCYVMRRVVNSDPSRIIEVCTLLSKHKRLIVFYNFDYELEILRSLKKSLTVRVAEYNGHYHEEVPDSDSWIYLVNYGSGAEAWNCIETNAIVFYSQNYSYRIMTQAAGRIDRLNTKYVDLYYYHFRSESWIDSQIRKALTNKESFNEKASMKF